MRDDRLPRWPGSAVAMVAPEVEGGISCSVLLGMTGGGPHQAVRAPLARRMAVSVCDGEAGRPRLAMGSLVVSARFPACAFHVPPLIFGQSI